MKLRQRQELLLAKIWTRARTREKIIQKPDTQGELLFAVAATVDVVASIVGLLGRARIIHPLKLADLAEAQKRLKTATENFER